MSLLQHEAGSVGTEHASIIGALVVAGVVGMTAFGGALETSIAGQNEGSDLAGVGDSVVVSGPQAASSGEPPVPVIQTGQPATGNPNGGADGETHVFRPNNSGTSTRAAASGGPASGGSDGDARGTDTDGTGSDGDGSGAEAEASPMLKYAANCATTLKDCGLAFETPLTMDDFSAEETELWDALIALVTHRDVTIEELLAALMGQGDQTLAEMLNGLYETDNENVLAMLGDPDQAAALARRFVMYLGMQEVLANGGTEMTSMSESMGHLLSLLVVADETGADISDLMLSSDFAVFESIFESAAEHRAEATQSLYDAAVVRYAAAVEEARAAEAAAATPRAPANVGSQDAQANRNAVYPVLQEYAARHGWNLEQEWASLNALVTAESSWQNAVKNPNSTAYGLFQFLNSTWGLVGATKTDDPTAQARAGLEYIVRSYGTPTNAWQTHQSRCGSELGCWY